MALKKIELPKTEFTFSDGQTVELKAPTLDILQNAQKKSKDEIEQAKLMTARWIRNFWGLCR